MAKSNHKTKKESLAKEVAKAVNAGNNEEMRDGVKSLIDLPVVI